MNSPTLYLEWQNTQTRRWYTIGRLQRDAEGLFEFVYTQGFNDATQQGGLQPLVGFDDPSKTYRSKALFPQFENRLMSPSREEFPINLERLGLKDATDPLAVLARSGGRRETDRLLLYAAPDRVVGTGTADLFRAHFFINGARYTPSEGLGSKLEEPLRLLWDFQNPEDPNAVMVSTRDNHLLGWIPRHFAADILALRDARAALETAIERVNPPPAPAWCRYLITVSALWPEGFRALGGPEHLPMVQG